MNEKAYEQPPFKRGDEIMDDGGEFGFVLEGYTAAHWSPTGKLIYWRTDIHYRWDQPSYGKKRNVTEGEIDFYIEEGA